MFDGFYECLEQIALSAAEAVRPAERLTVSEAAAKYRFLNNPGSYVGPWLNEKAPYLIEPQNELTSLDYTSLIFAGPARIGKSDMFFNWLTHSVKCDPANMMVVNMTMSVARDWSNGDLRRAIRTTPVLKERQLPGKRNDNTFDKHFENGMDLLVKWPTITELSGKTMPRVALNDYDRMPQNIDAQGNPFDLARKRTTTFGRFAMTYAEGSPGFPINDPKWMQKTPHEAPPCEGILALYNRGDRRRFYWRCPQCREAFEPSFSLFNYPKSKDKMESAEQVILVCPHDGFPMEPSMKSELNLGGKWIKEGQVWMPDGSVTGTPVRSNIASFWLKGPAAAFQSWQNMVLNYLNAVEEYESTGKEEALKVAANTDQGEAYLPKALENGMLPEDLKNRAQNWGGTADEPVVPQGVRFLVATIDVQHRAFVCQIQGVGLGGDTWIVDCFKIRKSKRLDKDGDPKPIDPASYPEDWQIIVDEVLERSYPLGDNSGRWMSIKATSCDLSGEAGVTMNGVGFWRWLRDTHEGDHHKRFQLVKGEPKDNTPLVQLRYPESTRKDRNSSMRGDVPVLFINSTKAKDKVAGMLGRVDPTSGEISLVGGQVNFPHWLEFWFYQQLTAEIRTASRWENKNQKRNEAWDLLVYSYATCMNARQISPTIDRIDWQNPPMWACDWDDNDLVFDPDAGETLPIKRQDQPTYDLSSLASDLA